MQVVERSRRLAGCSRARGGGGLGAKEWIGWLLWVGKRLLCLLVGAASSLPGIVFSWQALL